MGCQAPGKGFEIFGGWALPSSACSQGARAHSGSGQGPVAGPAELLLCACDTAATRSTCPDPLPSPALQLRHWVQEGDKGQLLALQSYCNGRAPLQQKGITSPDPCPAARAAEPWVKKCNRKQLLAPDSC